MNPQIRVEVGDASGTTAMCRQLLSLVHQVVTSVNGRHRMKSQAGLLNPVFAHVESKICIHACFKTLYNLAVSAVHLQSNATAGL